MCAIGVQVAELQRSIKFPTLEVAENRASWAEPKHKAGDLHLPERMRNLGVVFERLWRFYEAMHNGKPIQNSDEILPQMGTALKSAIRPGNSV
jgi:hypothetical protein